MSLIEKIDAEIAKIYTDEYKFNSDEFKAGKKSGLSHAMEIFLSEQKESCNICKGCKHDGKYENELEYGYPSPCTFCKRRRPDNYLNQPYTEQK